MHFVLSEYKTLSKELEAEVYDFRRNTSKNDGTVRTDEEWTKHLEKYCSDDDIFAWILVHDKDKLVGITAIFKRQITLNGKNIALGGIGKVRVKEEYRRKGIASQMMKRAMEILQSMRCDIALLSPDPSPFVIRFYEKFGFLMMQTPYIYFGKSGGQYTDYGMVFPYNMDVRSQILTDKVQLNIGKGNW